MTKNTPKSGPMTAEQDTGGDEQGFDRLSEFVDLRAQLELQAPVIEAARAMANDWRNSSPHGHVRHIIAAVDALGPVVPEATDGA